MAKTSISFRDMGTATIARVEGPRIAPDCVDLLQEKLLAGKGVLSGRRFVFDLSHVTFLGSVGLSVMIVFLKRVKECRGQLALAGLNPQCMRVMQITRLTKIMPVYGDVSSALSALKD